MFDMTARRAPSVLHNIAKETLRHYRREDYNVVPHGLHVADMITRYRI